MKENKKYNFLSYTQYACAILWFSLVLAFTLSIVMTWLLGIFACFWKPGACESIGEVSQFYGFSSTDVAYAKDIFEWLPIIFIIVTIVYFISIGATTKLKKNIKLNILEKLSYIILPVMVYIEYLLFVYVKQAFFY